MMTNRTAKTALRALALSAAMVLGFSCSDDDNGGKKDQGVAGDLAGDGSGLDLMLPDQQLADLSPEQLPQIDRILPDDGLTTASTAVVLLGKNFKHPVTVYINGGEDGILTDTSVSSDISMSFSMPVSPLPDKTTPFKVRVRIKSGGVFSNSVDYQYTVTDPMSEGFKGSLRTASLSTYRDFLSDPVEGQVYVDPADPASELVAEVGMGPDGSSPLDAGSWRWFPAEPAGQEGDYQLFAGGVVAYLQQPYDLAYRFSKDGGQRWIYADRDEGNLEYQAAQAGALTVELAPEYYCQKADDCIKYAFEWTCDLKSDQDNTDNRCVQCLADADCQGNPNALGPRCNVSQQECYCQDAQDCTDNPHGSACTSSYCGCESHDNCVSPKQCFEDDATGMTRCLTPP